MLIKRIIFSILLVIWMVVIFIFSNQNANNSQATSDKVASSIIDTVTEVTKQEISKEKKESLIDQTRIFVRKTAHFTLFFVLGILAYITLTNYSVSKIVIYSILFCFLYACSDEIHQLFLSGRSARILDVFIDTCGACVGIILVYFVHKKLINNKLLLR